MESVASEPEKELLIISEHLLFFYVCKNAIDSDVTAPEGLSELHMRISLLVSWAPSEEGWPAGTGR